MPLNIIAAIAVKRIMERDKLPGTIILWPGVAEELVASKAWFVRDGMFKDVDVDLNLFFTSAIVTQEIRNGTRSEDDIPDYLLDV